MTQPRKLILRSGMSPGDIVMLTAAVRDLHKCNPGKFVTDVRTSTDSLWENNPNVTTIGAYEVYEDITCEYPAIHECGDRPIHFIYGFIEFLADKLGVAIRPTKPHGDIHISGEEKGWLPQVREVTEDDRLYWIIDAGRKNDFTAKHWEFAKFQAVVDGMPDITFVQVGGPEKDHTHPPLTGPNVINMVGKTDHRQFVRMMYHAAGVITPVSYPMHLSAAIPDKRSGGVRPCVVLAGGREPRRWEAYDGHTFFDAIGLLPCCLTAGCWKSRTVRLNDGDEKDHNLCKRPILTVSGQHVPECLDIVSARNVIDAVRTYVDSPAYRGEKDVDKAVHLSPPPIQAIGAHGAMKAGIVPGLQLAPKMGPIPVPNQQSTVITMQGNPDGMTAQSDVRQLMEAQSQIRALWTAINHMIKEKMDTARHVEARIRALEKRLADMFDDGDDNETENMLNQIVWHPNIGDKVNITLGVPPDTFQEIGEVTEITANNWYRVRTKSRMTDLCLRLNELSLPSTDAENIHAVKEGD